MSARTRHMALALLGLVGLFISVYLLLHRLGVYGALLCGPSGGCGAVQASRWATFLGIPVPAWGVGWYASVFAVALAAVHSRPGAYGWQRPVLFLLGAGGLAFTGYLTYLEMFVIEAWCRWCIVSAVLTVLIFLLALPGVRALGPLGRKREPSARARRPASSRASEPSPRAREEAG